VVAATGGIFLVYIVSFVLSFFGTTVPYIHESGTIGILFSLFVVVVAALNLVLDFDFIEHGAEQYTVRGLGRTGGIADLEQVVVLARGGTPVLLKDVADIHVGPMPRQGAVIRDGKLHVQAGAGIVADSDPEAEWEETMNKGRALITAVDRASRGL